MKILCFNTTEEDSAGCLGKRQQRPLPGLRMEAEMSWAYPCVPPEPQEMAACSGGLTRANLQPRAAQRAASLVCWVQVGEPAVWWPPLWNQGAVAQVEVPWTQEPSCSKLRILIWPCGDEKRIPIMSEVEFPTSQVETGKGKSLENPITLREEGTEKKFSVVIKSRDSGA